MTAALCAVSLAYTSLGVMMSSGAPRCRRPAGRGVAGLKVAAGAQVSADDASEHAAAGDQILPDARAMLQMRALGSGRSCIVMHTGPAGRRAEATIASAGNTVDHDLETH